MEFLPCSGRCLRSAVLPGVSVGGSSEKAEVDDPWEELWKERGTFDAVKGEDGCAVQGQVVGLVAPPVAVSAGAVVVQEDAREARKVVCQPTQSRLLCSHAAQRTHMMGRLYPQSQTEYPKTVCYILP